MSRRFHREPRDAPEKTADSAPLVFLEGVSKAYRSDGNTQTVLEDVSLEVAAGEFTALLGPSGSGKTTLLNVVGALDQPDTGTVRVCGTELEGATPESLAHFRARSVGFIFQFYNLLPTLTALENVVAGMTIAGIPRRKAREEAAAFLDRVGLEQRKDRFPNQLSGGEQQRVAIVRALAKGPQLVLADEPTGNLDTSAGDEVTELMHRLNEETGTTFLIVTHDPALAATAERVVRLSDGRLAAPGT
jgi:ABC-type lipoprotein export system ATPase subunit